MSDQKTKKIALVLSGGGARGAYEAGVIHYIRTMLPLPFRERNFDILCGNSIGAVNTAFLASFAHDPGLQGRSISKVWEGMREEMIYRTDLMALLELIFGNFKGFLLNLVRAPENRRSYFQSLLNSSPSLDTLKKAIHWSRITKNVTSGKIDAVSIVATNIFTGRPELFIQKNKNIEYSGDIKTHFTQLEPVHVLASGAIPIVFSPVMIKGIPYTDGGLRLNTPLSPAIQLGADKIIVIGLHHRSPEGEILNQRRNMNATFSEVLGRVMDSLFVDKIESDLEQLIRINHLLEVGESLYKDDFITQLNSHSNSLKEEKKLSRKLKKIDILRIEPSENLGKIFSYCFEKKRDLYFSTVEKWLFRFLDIDPRSGNELLSYISFMPDYLKTLLYMGFEDARSQHEKLKDFLT